MKPLCKYVISFLLLVSSSAFAGVEVKKSFSEAYPTNENTALQVSNRFGSIVINNTTNDEISIKVDVKVEASNERKAQEILDRIAIIINKVGNTVSAYTEIENASWRGNVELNIDYLITMPAHLKTTLEMKYGDVDIDQLTGHFAGEVKYGEFKANHLVDAEGGLNYLDLAYCDASFIGVVGRFELEMSYSDCRIAHGEALNYEVKYSDFEIGDIKMLNGEMAYSDMEVELTNNIVAEAKYSDLSIETVVESIELESKYSDIDIDFVEKEFSLVVMEVAYGDVEIKVSPEAAYHSTLSVNYGDISYPPMEMKSQDQAGNSESVSGFIGRAESRSRFEVDVRYGDLLVR